MMDTLKKIKNILRHQELANNLRNHDFLNENSACKMLETQEDVDKVLQDINTIIGKEKNGIYSSSKTIKVYNPSEPIYIEGEDGKIYTFDKNPEVKLDLTPKKIYCIFAITPLLEKQGYTKQKIKNVMDCIRKGEKRKEDEFPSRMCPFRVDTNREEYFVI